jgi:hypothetical protein
MDASMWISAGIGVAISFGWSAVRRNRKQMRVLDMSDAQLEAEADRVMRCPAWKNPEWICIVLDEAKRRRELRASARSRGGS